jgi:hypothetical protein
VYISTLPAIVPVFDAFDDLFVVVSPDKVEVSRDWV